MDFIAFSKSLLSLIISVSLGLFINYAKYRHKYSKKSAIIRIFAISFK